MSVSEPDEPNVNDTDGALPEDSAPLPEDEVWQSIIENFGDRAELEAWEKRAVDNDAPLPASGAPLFGDDVDEFDPDDYIDPEDEFVAPRPSLPKTTPSRFVAWTGAVGAPMATVILYVLHATIGLWIPGWVTTFLIVAFLAGFGFLVATMPKTRDDPFDDGARL